MVICPQQPPQAGARQTLFSASKGGVNPPPPSCGSPRCSLPKSPKIASPYSHSPGHAEPGVEGETPQTWAKGRAASMAPHAHPGVGGRFPAPSAPQESLPQDRPPRRACPHNPAESPCKLLIRSFCDTKYFLSAGKNLPIPYKRTLKQGESSFLQTDDGWGCTRFCTDPASSNPPGVEIKCKFNPRD